jgi:RimJ/RimL family protein N-acetyltransferase
VDISLGPRFPERELGWILFDGAEGRGIATEAASALRDWAAARGWTGLVSYIDPANHRSIALAQRLGARLDPHAVPQDPGDLVYRHRSASPAA